jgi:uncharacterized membrane protein
MWLVRHRVRSFWRNSLWLLPTLGIVGAILAVRALHAIEVSAGWVSSFKPEAVTLVLSSLAAAMFTLVVFVASALLITMQLASAQLTPRVIGLLFRDVLMKGALTAWSSRSRSRCRRCCGSGTRRGRSPCTRPRGCAWRRCACSCT